MRPLTVRVVLALLLAALASGAFAAGDARAWLPPEPGPDHGCTVVEPSHRITLEVTIPDSYEYCPLLARALSEDVLHRPVGIIARRWHYPNAVRSCRLQQRPPDQKRRITIYNSARSCRWLVLSGWQVRAPAV